MTTTIREILTEAQLERVTEITKSEPPSFERTKKLREYLITLRTELEAKGVLPEYLTYVIEYEEMLAIDKFLAEERKNVQNN